MTNYICENCEMEDCPSKNKESIMKKQSRSIELIRAFPDISACDLEEILEHLSDNNFLSEEGLLFRTEFWKTFIKE